MTFPRAIFLPFLVLLFAVLASTARAIEPGETRASVLHQLGKPTSSAQRGEREFLYYPREVRIELLRGRVVSIQGDPNPIAPRPADAFEDPLAPTPPLDATATATAGSGAADTAQGQIDPAVLYDDPDTNPAVAVQGLSDMIERQENGGHATEADSYDEKSSLLHAPLALLVAVAVQFGITLLALRLAFKFWEMDAFWKGIFAIAGIDAALRVAFEALGPLTHGLTTMHAVQAGVPGVVMIFTIRRFCFSKNLQNAVLTAGFVKVLVMVIELYAMLGVMKLFRS